MRRSGCCCILLFLMRLFLGTSNSLFLGWNRIIGDSWVGKDNRTTLTDSPPVQVQVFFILDERRQMHLFFVIFCVLILALEIPPPPLGKKTLKNKTALTSFKSQSAGRPINLHIQIHAVSLMHTHTLGLVNLKQNPSIC